MVTKEKDVRKHFAILDKITHKLIFYDIISFGYKYIVVYSSNTIDIIYAALY